MLRNFAGNPTGPLTVTYNSLGGNATDETVSSGQFMVGSMDIFGSATLASTVSSGLAPNGGATMTHSISRGSPAQRNGLSSTVAIDQRGAPRHLHADAGAFELIEPELGVSVSEVPILENGTLAFGSTPFDTPVVKTITITNTQTSAFTTGPLMLASLSIPAGYTSVDFPANSLGNGHLASFTVTLSAIDAGLFNAPLTFTGNDAFDPTLAVAGAAVRRMDTSSISPV